MVIETLPVKTLLTTYDKMILRAKFYSLEYICQKPERWRTHEFKQSMQKLDKRPQNRYFISREKKYKIENEEIYKLALVNNTKKLVC